MNYFELLNIEKAFEIDMAELEAAYFRAQRETHPDRFVGKSDSERQAALQRSVDVNEAYHTLKTPLRRAQYILSLHGVIIGTDKDTVKPSQALLMEALELREEPPTASALQTMIASCIAAIIQHYNDADYKAMAQEALRLGYLEKITTH